MGDPVEEHNKRWKGIKVAFLNREKGKKGKKLLTWEFDLQELAVAEAKGKRWRISLSWLLKKLGATSTADREQTLGRAEKLSRNAFEIGSYEDRESRGQPANLAYLWSKKRYLYVPPLRRNQHTGPDPRSARRYYRAKSFPQPKPVDEWKHLRDATGFYDDRKKRDRTGRTLQLNHAGRAIFGWIQDHSLRAVDSRELAFERRKLLVFLDGTPAKGKPAKYVGHLWEQSQDDAKARAKKKPLELSVDSKGRVLLELPRPDAKPELMAFERALSRARLSDRAIAAVPARLRPLVLARESYPFSPSERGRLHDFVKEVRKRVRMHRKSPTKASVVLDFEQNARSLLKDFYRMFPGGSSDQPERGESPQLPLAEWLIEQALDTPILKDGQTYLDGVDEILRFAKTEQLKVPALLLVFGPPAPKHKSLYRYTWYFELKGLAGSGSLGVEVGGGAREGKFVIRCDEITNASGKSPTVTHKKTHTLHVLLAKGSLGGGVSAGASVSTWERTADSDFTRPYYYEPQDLDGPFVIFSAEVGAGAYFGVGGGVSEAKAHMSLFCKGRYPDLYVDASGSTVEAGVGKAAGVSASGTLALGHLFASDSDFKSAYEKLKRKQHLGPKIKARVSSSAKASFGFDKPDLTEGGRSELGAFCAEYLAALRQEKTRLELIGHASRAGKSDYNLDLSAVRALFSLQAIKDLVGKRQFKVSIGPMPDDVNRTHPPEYKKGAVRGRGELDAKGAKDGVDDPKQRRVDIEIDHYVSYQLREST